MHENINILVVDDEAPIRKLFQAALNQKGYAADIAESAEQALEFIKHNTYDIYFLDLSLPGMNGIDLCRTIMARQPEAWAYAITGYASNYKSDECFNAGFKAYFTKPVSLQILYEAVSEFIKKR